MRQERFDKRKQGRAGDLSTTVPEFAENVSKLARNDIVISDLVQVKEKAVAPSVMQK